MSGLDVAAGVAGLISLSVTLVDGCIKGFVLFSDAQGYGSRAEIFCCQLEWQQYHLYRWATLVGLFKSPPELNVPNLSVVLPLIERTLRSLEKVLTDADTLQDDYGLKVEVTDDEIKDVQNTKRLFNRSKVLPTLTTKEFVNDTAKVYQRRASKWQRFKWAAFNATKFEALIKDIQFFNDQLRTTLHVTEQGQYASANSDTLRSLVAQTQDQALLDIITQKLNRLESAIEASARLKKKSLLLEVLEDDTKLSGHNTPSFLSSATLVVPSVPASVQRKPSPARGLLRDYVDLLRSPEAAVQFENREIAKYKNRSVVLEWKNVPASMERRLKHRIAAVAELLADMNDSTFHSLMCIGFVKEPRRLRYAYIFQPPIDDVFSMRSLQSLLTSEALRPSINLRLAIAAALAETVLQLHTAGWLHKSIRSDNVLFFRNDSTQWKELQVLPKAYLGGYEFARGDNIVETTEDPSLYEPSRLYRHPLSLSEDRLPFCKAFDLYSLGCVLLEIGLWRPLLTMVLDWTRTHSSSVAQLQDYHSPPHSTALGPSGASEWGLVFQEKEKFLSSARTGAVANELSFCMGNAYASVVKRCLDASTAFIAQIDDPNDDVGFSDTDSDSSIDIQMESLQILRSILDHI